MYIVIRAGWVRFELPRRRAARTVSEMGTSQQTIDGASSSALPLLNGRRPWRDRLRVIVEMMREMSQQTDPQAMVQAYSARVREILAAADAFMSLSRRDLERPQYRITRSTQWKDRINPWKQKELLPLLQGGLLAELIYGDEPVIIDDLQVSPDDPAQEYLQGYRSLIAIPNFDRGVALNMIVRLARQPNAFDPEQLPEQVWMSNLFGRATHNLVLSDELRRANEQVNRELRVVADIQRSLLPAELPRIPTLDLAAHYQTSRQAGGDYYDFFELPDGRWGILIADVSGHGTPAAVLMAVTHSIAHSFSGPLAPPAHLLEFLNHHLAARYCGSGNFVTAFYGIYDPATRTLEYSRAGHCPPRIKRCGGDVIPLDRAAQLPLGVDPDERYEQACETLQPGDSLIFYTDGITEARGRNDDMFGIARLDKVLADCHNGADELVRSTLRFLDEFTQGQPADDDRTLIAATVS